MSNFNFRFSIKMSNEVLNLTVIEWVTRNQRNANESKSVSSKR